MMLDGRQSVDMDMDYQVQNPLKLVRQVVVNTLFKKKKNPDGTEEDVNVDELPADDIVARPIQGKVSYLYVHLVGSPDNFKIKPGKRK